MGPAQGWPEVSPLPLVFLLLSLSHARDPLPVPVPLDECLREGTAVQALVCGMDEAQ